MAREPGGVSRRRVLAGAVAGGVAAAGAVEVGAAQRVAVDPALGESEGTVEAVVTLESPDRPDDLDRARTVQKLREDAANAQATFRSAVSDRAGITVERGFWLANAVLVTVDTDAVPVEELAAHDVVSAVEANRTVEGPPNPPDGPAGADAARSNRPTATGSAGSVQPTYPVEMVGAPAVWNFYGTRGEGVDVCVIDTGVDPSGHGGIQESLDRGGWAEFDGTGERADTDPRDPDGHGTSVSSLVVGETTDDGAQYGVAPDANLYVARFSDTLAANLAAFDWAVENGVDVISASWGPLRYARNGGVVENARAAGTLVVGSVGNAGRYTSASPGNLVTTVGVGAVDRDGTVPEWSGGEVIDTQRYWGRDAEDSWPDEYTVPQVTAPGVDVTAASAGGGYGSNEGASYSTPLVAGVAALVLSATDASTGVDVEDLVVDTAMHPDARDPFAVDPGHDDRHGTGVVNAMRAVTRANATESVAGRITDPDGNPVAGADVVSEAGVRTTADGDGRYELAVPPGEQPIGATALGYDISADLVDPAERDRFDLTLQPNDAPAADLQAAFGTRVDPGAATTATVETANVTAVTVDVETAGPLSADQLSLSVAGESAAFGESTAVAGDGDVEVAVEVASGALPGQFEASLRFDGGGEGEPVTGRLDPVYVHPDPLRVDPQVPSLGAVVDLVAPGTVVTMESGTYEEVADGGPHALVVDEPVSLVAAEGESPEVAVGGDAESAVFVSANDVKLAGLRIDASGAGAAVRAGHGIRGRDSVGPSGLTVRNNELAGAAAGVIADVAPALWVEDNVIAAERVGVEVRDPQKTAVRRNEITGGGTGIAVGGIATEVAGNEVRDVERVGILVGTPRGFGELMGPVADNLVDGAGAGIVVEGFTAGPVVNNRIANVQGPGVAVTGGASGPIRGNVIDGAAIGLDFSEGVVSGPVDGNEFRNVETEQLGSGDAPATGDGTATPRADATAGPVEGGRPPEESSMDAVLYAATALSMGVLLVPYGLRRYWRR